MESFNLKIVTADGIKFEGQAESILVRTVTGNVSIWAKHTDYVTALGIGKAVVTVGGQKKVAACNGGVMSVCKNEVTVLASTFEWKEEIDAQRAEIALKNAKDEIANAKDKNEAESCKEKAKRAMTRIEVKNS